MNQFMMKAIMVVVGVPVVIGVTSQAELKTQEKYNITEIEVPVFDSCKTGMSVNDIKFHNGASANKGCACITKYAASEYYPQDFEVYNKVLRSKLRLGKAAINASSTEDQVKLITDGLEALEKIEEETGVSSSKLIDMSENMSKAIKVCGDTKTHKSANVQVIAAMPRKGEPVARVAEVEQSPAKPSPVTTIPALRK